MSNHNQNAEDQIKKKEKELKEITKYRTPLGDPSRGNKEEYNPVLNVEAIQQEVGKNYKLKIERGDERVISLEGDCMRTPASQTERPER